MSTDVINAPALTALVKPVRALLKKNKKIEAIKLVRERMAWGLKESLDFVNHVEARHGVRAVKVAELWTSTISRELDTAAPSHHAEPAGTSTGNTRETANPNSTSLAELYAHYMEAHTYSDWERLVEKCLAAKSTEEEL